MVEGIVIEDSITGILSVYVNGSLVPAPWPAAYPPVAGDTVTVLIIDGSARVLGPTSTGARPLTGTVNGSASGGKVPISTSAGVLFCRYVGTVPATGSLVRLDWAATEPWIWPTAAAIVPPPVTPPTPPAPPPPPDPGPTTGTLSLPAVASSTWRSDSGWGRWGTALRQFRYGSEAESHGAWFYGSTARQLAGRTITAARIYLPAREGVGSYNAALAARLYRHTSDSQPAGDVSRVAGPESRTLAPIGNGATGWVDLPAAWGQAIVDSGGGVGISGSPYLGLVGVSADAQSGLIQLDWRR